MNKGFSLIEVLVVVMVFAVLVSISAQALITTVTNSRKANATVRVRENLEFALSVMERHIRNANGLTSLCVAGAPMQSINYTDQWGQPGSFSCNPAGSQDFVASAGARLTANTVSVTACSFVCTPASVGQLQSVDINLTGTSAANQGFSNTERATLSVSTKVFLRSY
jgi:prepilin-type N-terminal cleavage/methylation domain-containing protein